MPYPLQCDDTTLHFSTSYNRRRTEQELSDSRRDAIGCITSDRSLVSDCGWANQVLFNSSKTQFLQLFTQHNLPDNYLLFINDTQLPLSSTLNTPGLSFTKNQNLQFHIYIRAKSASKKLDVLSRLCPFFSVSQLLAYLRVWISCSGRVQLTKLY